MSQVWGFCGTCQRWFYPERLPERDSATAPACPVCSTEASRVEERVSPP